MAFFGSSIAGTARVVLGVDTRDFNRDLAQAESRFRTSTRNMDRDVGQLSRGVAAGSGAFQGFARSVAFASASFLGAAGFTSLVRQSIGAASDLNEAINATKVTFRDAAPAMLEWSETAAEALGMSQRAALENASSIGAMLIPMGFARSEAAEMSRAMVQLATDMGSMRNEDPSEMLDRIRSGLAGESEPLRRFGVDLRETAVQAYALREGLVKKGEALTAAGQLVARYRLLLEQTKDAQGDFARTAGTTANAQRTLQGTIEETQAALGQAFLPTVERLLPRLTEWADSIANNRELHQRMRDGIEDAIDTAGDMAHAADTVADALGGWRNTLETIFALGVATKVLNMARAFTLLAGTSAAAGAAAGTATGIGGAAARSGVLLANMRALARLGAITIPVYLAMNTDEVEAAIDKLNARINGNEAVRDFLTTIGLWNEVKNGRQVNDPIPGRPVGDSAADKRAVARGVGITPEVGASDTHGPRLLPAFKGPGIRTSAVDYPAPVGTPVRAPENGELTRTSGRPGSGTPGGPGGYSLYFVGESGTAYYMTHLEWVAPPGEYRFQDLIGRVGPHVSGPHAHVEQSRSRGAIDIAYSGRGSGPRPTPTLPDLAEPTEKADPKQRRRRRPRRRPGEPADPILEGLYLREARAADTRRLTDDLDVLRDLDAYLTKKIAAEKRVDEKTQLLRERQAIRGRLAEVQERLPVTLPGFVKPPAPLAGFGTVIGGFERLQGGQRAVTLPGLGQILVGNMDATRDMWVKLSGQLKKKLRAAMQRRKTLERNMQRARNLTLKRAREAAIARISPDLQRARQQEEDLRDALGAALTAISEIDETATSEAQRAAEEAEQKQRQEAEEALQESERAAAAFQRSLVDTPLDIQLAQALAGGTPDVADDIAAYRRQESFLAGNLGRGNLETEIQLVNSLNSVREQIKRLEEAQQKGTAATLTLVDVERERVGYLMGLRQLRGYQGNLWDPLASLHGATIQVVNNFQQPPSDGHIWSREVEFELRGLLG